MNRCSYLTNWVNNMYFKVGKVLTNITIFGASFCLSSALRRKIRIFFSLWISLCVLLLAVPDYGCSQENLYVDFDKVIQENFLGVNAVYHAFTYMPESIEQGMTAELREIEMARVKASGLRIARTFYRPDWAMGEREWSQPDWESVKMNALYAWLTDMQKIGVDVALNMGWWFPRDVIWNRDQHLPSYPDDIHSYTKWVSESLRQIVEVRKFTNVKYIFMFTEPGNQFGDIPNGKKNWDYYKEVLVATHNRLVADGRRDLVKIVGPNTTQAPRWVGKAGGELNEIVDIYASHNYNFDNYKDWYALAVKVADAARSSGKPFWIDEYGIQEFSRRKTAEYGNIIAQANAAFLNSGAQSSLIWILNDQYYPYPLKYITNGDAFLDGKHSWGLFPWLPESKGLRPAWYAFAMLSKFLGGEGAKTCMTKGTENLHVAAVTFNGGGRSLLLVNGTDSQQDFSIHLSDPITSPIYIYAYNPAGLLLSRSELGQKGELIVDSIPAKGVRVYSTIKAGQIFGFDDLSSLASYDESTEENLAYGKKSVGSSGEQQLPLENLTDGMRLTYIDLKELGGGGRDIVIDLEKMKELRQVDLYLAESRGFAGDDLPGKIFQMFVSADRKNLVPLTLQDKTENSDMSILSYKFQPQLGRYIHLSINRPEGRANDTRFIKINEIKAYGRQVAH